MNKYNGMVVLTPTYNRVDTLPKLYESLLSQINKNFKWLIIDDGSTDCTKEYIDLIKKDNIINVEYIYQQNGGKVRALNKGFSSCDNALVFIVVDSDDYLLKDAIGIIDDYLYKYDGYKDIGALFFHYKAENGEIINPSGKMIENDKIMTRYEYNNIYNKNDGCVCYLNKVVEKYKYPEFEGEKYVGPTVIQMEMSSEFNMVFSPKVIGVAEYLEGGLSKSGRKLRLENPKGMIYYSKLMINSQSKFLIRIKGAISMWVYAKIARYSYSETIRLGDKSLIIILTYIPGQILYYFWTKRNS